MDYQREHRPHKRRRKRNSIILNKYRVATFGIANSQISAFSSEDSSTIPPVILVVGAGNDTLFVVSHPFDWLQRVILYHSMPGLDIEAGTFLGTVTGGLSNPFLRYTLAPVPTAARHPDSKLTANPGLERLLWLN